MEETYINGKTYHIGPKKVNNKEAANILTNPFCKSVTKYITPVTVEYKKNKFITICDTPGFDDSNGVEVDIANGISVIKAI